MVLLRARYTTHVPVYDLTAAAGLWGPESVPNEIGWTEVPGVSLKPGMFVARVTGTSMEPHSAAAAEPGVRADRD